MRAKDVSVETDCSIDPPIRELARTESLSACVYPKDASPYVVCFVVSPDRPESPDGTPFHEEDDHLFDLESKNTVPT